MRRALLVWVIATAIACDGGTHPSADCMSWPVTTLLAASPSSGTTLAPSQSVDVSAVFQFTACRTAGVSMYALDQSDRTIAVRGNTSAHVPVGVTTQAITGTLTVPEQGATAVGVHFVMLLGARSGPNEVARLDYPVR